MSGTTISFAGKPNIKANKIAPSRPIALPNGSRMFVACDRSDMSPTCTFAKSQITSPAGAATAAARFKICSVLSKIDRTIIAPTSGRRYGGSSRTKEEGSPFNTVPDKSLDTPKVTKIPDNITAVRSRAPDTDLMIPESEHTKNIEITEMRVGSFPLQGIKEFVRIAMSRSRGESIILQPVTPTALHPSPIHIKTEI